MTRQTMLATTLICGLVASGCANAAGACQSLGVCDPPPVPPIAIDLICDHSTGAPCTRDTIGETLDVMLPVLAARPGSALRLWAIGASVDAVRAIADVVAPDLPPGTRARHGHTEAFVKSTRSALLRAAEAALAEPPKQSPIADALARVTLAPVGHAKRIVVLISDMREFGRFDFECGPLPDADRFAARLRTERLFDAQTLKGAGVAFTYVGVPAVDGRRCRATIERAKSIQDLWVYLVTSAGGEVLQYGDGPLMPSYLIEDGSR